MVKRIARRCLRVAYHCMIWWRQVTGVRRNGAAVAVWDGDELLLVRHSYRPGYALPGGRVKRGEGPGQAACRELREEVGLDLRPEDLRPAPGCPNGASTHIFEYCVRTRPQLRIDNWEIVEACLLNPAKILIQDEDLRRYLRRRLAAPEEDARARKRSRS